MNKVANDRQIIHLTEWGLFRSNVYRTLKRPYLVTALSCYVMVMLLVLLYMAKPATFRSEMELVLPGTGARNSISLNDVGEVVSQTTTPFSGGGFNPRVNYKEMLSSRGVLQTASARLGMDLKEFGKPKIKLTEQTSIIKVSIIGRSEKESQSKAWELYRALQFELDELRADEILRRDESIKNVLERYREQVNLARNDVIEFQQSSLLVEREQLALLLTNHAENKSYKLSVRAELAQATRFVEQLSIDVGMSPNLAGQALKLSTDAEYLGYISEMDDSAAKLSEFRSRWGDKHPQVVTEKLRYEQSKKSLFTRAQFLVGYKAEEVFGLITFDENSKRAQLFADLIEAYAKQQGLQAKLGELQRTILHLDDQLKIYTREHAELDKLQRAFDLAEAVYTSAAARLEAGKADIFASYPVVQLLTVPSYPVIPASPVPAIGLLAGLIGSVFITLALVATWQRNSLRNLLLNRD